MSAYCNDIAGQIYERHELDVQCCNWIPGWEEVASQVPERRELYVL